MVVKAFLRLCIFMFSISVVLWSGGLVWYLVQIHSYENGQDETRTDVIVVLTGGSQRIITGLELLAKNYGRQLFISGVDKNIGVNGLLQAKGYPPNLAENVHLGYKAANTCENAKEVVEWMQANGYQSLRLVSSNYHMQRSLVEFDSEQANFKIIPHSVSPELFFKTEWKWKIESMSVVLTEYNKFLMAIVINQFDHLKLATIDKN